MGQPTEAIRVHGIVELQAALRIAPKEIAKGVRRDLRDAAGPAVAAARQTAHVGPTGAYQRSIRAKTGRVGVLVGSNRPETGVLNFGRESTQRSGRGPNRSYTRRLHPFPHIVRAVENQGERVAGVVAQIVQQSLDETLVKTGAAR